LRTLDSFEFAGLQEADELARFAHYCHRADPVSLHQLLRVCEGCVWLDEEAWRNGAHDVTRACEVPAFARQSFQIFECQHAVQAAVLRDWKMAKVWLLRELSGGVREH